MFNNPANSVGGDDLKITLWRDKSFIRKQKQAKRKQQKLQKQKNQNRKQDEYSTMN